VYMYLAINTAGCTVNIEEPINISRRLRGSPSK